MGSLGMPELIVIAIIACVIVIPVALGVALAIVLVRRHQTPANPPPPLPPGNQPS